MLKSAYLLAKIGADTAENEQNFAKILPKSGNYPTGPLRLAAPAPLPPRLASRAAFRSAARADCTAQAAWTSPNRSGKHK